jgi:DnaK suppressor protein
MDDARARQLLDTERARVVALIADTERSGQQDREAADEPGDLTDNAEPLTHEEVDDALVQGLRDRLDALDRAEARLRAGSYGRSVRSGAVIPDDRLEADPAAELTVDEATLS